MPVQPLPVSRPTTPRLLVALALSLACLGAVARFWDLGRMVVWHDEVFSVARVLGYGAGEAQDALYNAGHVLRPKDLQRFQTADPSRTWADTWRALQGHPEHGPLYYLLARIGSGLTESAVVGLRGTSAALSLLLLPAMAWLARELFGRGPAPWIAVALAAVAPIHLLYAQEARQYAFWSVLVAASSAALLRALRRGGSSDWALYAGLVAVGLYTHLLMAVTIAIHALYGLWREHRHPTALRGFALRFAAAAGTALLLFLPWIIVMLHRFDEMRDYTGWMAAPARLDLLVFTWATDLARPFVDLPGLPLAWLGVMPLLVVAVRHTAHYPERRLLWLLALVPLAMVALPDVFIGGRRSLESRYLMPSFLALELFCVGALSSAFTDGGKLRRFATALLALTVGAGLVSQGWILAADTWWTKSYSAKNGAFARRVNSAPHPLILASDGAVNVGELLSLSYWLQPHVRLLLQSHDAPIAIPAGYTDLFALLPGKALRAQLETDYLVRPFDGTWQWYVLVPRPPVGDTP